MVAGDAVAYLADCQIANDQAKPYALNKVS